MDLSLQVEGNLRVPFVGNSEKFPFEMLFLNSHQSSTLHFTKYKAIKNAEQQPLSSWLQLIVKPFALVGSNGPIHIFHSSNVLSKQLVVD